MQHSPTLHIFIGEHNHYFTLRESYLHIIYIERKPFYEIRYGHLKNLSQNFTEAVEKAKEASKAMGIPLVVRETEEEQLREIKRRTAEEIDQEKKLRAEKWRLAEEEAKQRRLNLWNIWVEEATFKLKGKIVSDRFDLSPEYRQKNPNFDEWAANNGWVVTKDNPNEYVKIMDIPQGPIMPVGGHKDTPISQVPISYLQWLIHKSGILEGVEDFTFNKMAFVAKWIKENMKISEPTESEFVGEVGQRMTRDLIVDSVRSFHGRFGISYIYKLLDEQGNNFVWFASKPALKNQTGKMTAVFNIKKHNDYDGTKQTVITRVKVV